MLSGAGGEVETSLGRPPSFLLRQEPRSPALGVDVPSWVPCPTPLTRQAVM